MSKKNNDLLTLIDQVNQLQRTLKNMGECIGSLSETIALNVKESGAVHIQQYPMLFCNKTKYITWLGKKCYTLGYHARDFEEYSQQLEKEFEEGENDDEKTPIDR